MGTHHLRNNKGFTLVETTIAAGLLSLVLIGTMLLLVTMLTIWSQGASGTSANTYACLAMRKLTLDIEEGKSASVVSGRLVVAFPHYDSSTGTYTKTQTGATAVYYLSGPTGTETSGSLTYLWKSSGGVRRKLASNVAEASFTVTNGVLVRINLKGVDPEQGSITPNYLQQSVKLRNS